MAEANVVEITGSEWASKGKSTWLKVQIAGEKFMRNIMDKEAQAQFTGPGQYELSWKQEGKYTNIVGFKPVKSTEVLHANGKTETRSVVRELDPNTILQNKSICAQVAVKAAAEIVAAMWTHVAAEEFMCKEMAQELTKMFLNEMRDFVNAPKSEAKKETNELTREPIPVA